MKKIRFLDLFGGIGGFRHGLENASKRYECAGYYDKDKYAVKSYNAIFGEEHDPVDVTELEAKEIPEHDLLSAGFPCQSFSIAGKREGFEDTRGTLFFEIARIAGAKEPEVLLLENVKGLLSHDNGYTFSRILQALDELGYYVEWQVLNSKHWGVPQNRERVFIIGHLGGEPRRKVFPIEREDTGDPGEDGGEGDTVTHNAVTGALGLAGSSREYLKSLQAVRKAEGLNTAEDGASYAIDKNYWMDTSLGDIGSGRRTQIVQQNQREEVVSKEETGAIHESMSSGQAPMVLNHQFRPETRPSIQEEGRSGGSGILFNSKYTYSLTESPHFVWDDFNSKMREDGNTGTLTPNFGSDAVRNGNKLVELVYGPDFVEKDWNKTKRVGSNDGEMFAVNGTSQHGVTDGVKIRKLTPKECWRLQGFPDESFHKARKGGISDTQLYKQAGNAVTVNVIEKLGEELLDYFGETGG